MVIKHKFVDRWRDDKGKWYTLYVNEQIKAFNMLVITEDWEKLWLFPRSEVLSMAKEQKKDIIQMWYNAVDKIATVKLMDLGKYYYQKKKDEKEKKKQKKIKWVKEVKFGYNIWENDLKFKLNKAKEFLKEWYYVKFVGFLRWRENVYKSIMYDKIKEIETAMTEDWKSQWIKEEVKWYSLILTTKNK